MTVHPVEPGLHPWTARVLAGVRPLDELGFDREDAARYVQAVDHALSDVAAHGEISRFGRRAYPSYVRRCVLERRRLFEVVRKHPEIEQIELRRPVFIAGLYRSGTTLLQRLLASSDDATAPLFWELRGVASAASPASKRRAAKWSRRIHRVLSPGFESAHEIRFDDPEECFHLFELSAATSPYWMTAAQDHADWLLEKAQRTLIADAYRCLRLQYQTLAWWRMHHGERIGRDVTWIFKWPYHSWHLDALATEFEDARIVVCRRDLDATVASTCSLAWHGLRAFCSHIDKPRLGRFWQRMCRVGAERLDASCGRLGSAVTAVDFRDLCAEENAVAAAVAERLGLAPPKVRVVRKVAARRPAHRYEPSDFGL